MYTMYHLRLLLIILTIVTQIVLHILILVLFLQRFYRCRKVDFWFKKLIRRNFVLRFELKLVLGVNVHFLIHHLGQLLPHHTVEIRLTSLPIAVFIIPLRHIFIFVVIWYVALRILLSIILHYVLLILLKISSVSSVLKLLTIYGTLG